MTLATPGRASKILSSTLAMTERELKILFALLAKRLSKKFYSILGSGILRDSRTRRKKDKTEGLFSDGKE